MLYNVHFGIYVDVAMPVEDKSKSLLPFLSSPKLLPDESEASFNLACKPFIRTRQSLTLGGCAGQPA